MGANAGAIEADRFGVDEAPLGQFAPMNGLAEARISKLVPFAGGTEDTRFPLSHLQTRFDSARSRGSLYVDHALVSKAQVTRLAGKSSIDRGRWHAAETLVSRASRCAFWRTDR